ncbi:MAG: CoA pyrophosphatase [Halovenus sp.]
MDFEGVRRHEPTEVTDEEQDAAVIVPILEREEPSMLFTKRADHLSNHPGQMSFPGGRREPEDEDLWWTALREGKEEVCLQPDEIRRVGRLDDIRTVTRFSVRPFVSLVPDRNYTPCEDEVAETAILPLAELTALDNYESERREHPHYGTIRLHFFRVDGYTVWGATARMLVQFLQLATDWEMPPEVDREVGPDADLPV